VSLSLDILRNGTPMATMSIRRTPHPHEYAYEIHHHHHITGRATVYGTVCHHGPEDLALVAAVLGDYYSTHSEHTKHPSNRLRRS
jgi:hypothetical protein